MGLGLDKRDFLRWSQKYDKDEGWLAQVEQELGSRFRRSKVMSGVDLARVVEWTLKGDEGKKRRVLELVTRNSEASVAQVSSQAFNLPVDDDACRINCLLMLEGVSPVLASVILAFFNPKRYGVFNVYSWRALLGNEVPNLFSAANYLKLLLALRKTAAKHNLDVRTVEKALFKKKMEEAGFVDKSSQMKSWRGTAKPKTCIRRK